MFRKIRKNSQWVNEANGPVIAVTLRVCLRGVVKTEKIGLRQNHLKIKSVGYISLQYCNYVVRLAIQTVEIVAFLVIEKINILHTL